jgi:hypothetical protein
MKCRLVAVTILCAVLFLVITGGSVAAASGSGRDYSGLSPQQFYNERVKNYLNDMMVRFSGTPNSDANYAWWFNHSIFYLQGYDQAGNPGSGQTASLASTSPSLASWSNPTHGLQLVTCFGNYWETAHS